MNDFKYCVVQGAFAPHMSGPGINFEDWVLEKIDRSLDYEDYRSDRVNNLCRVGLEAEEAAQSLGEWPEDVANQEELVRDAIVEYLQD